MRPGIAFIFFIVASLTGVLIYISFILHRARLKKQTQTAEDKRIGSPMDAINYALELDNRIPKYRPDIDVNLPEDYEEPDHGSDAAMTFLLDWSEGFLKEWPEFTARLAK